MWRMKAAGKEKLYSYMYTEKRKDEKELKRMKQDVKGEVRENRRSREKGSNAKIIGCRS